MDHRSIDIYLVIDTFLLLLIGVGPKIALAPFLEVTSEMDPATKGLVVRKMLTTAGVVAVLLVGLGELLVESPGGVSPPGARRSRREPLDSPGSCHPAVGRAIPQWANRPRSRSAIAARNRTVRVG